MNYHVISDIPQSLYQPILDMIHLAFSEHLEHGLHFTCSDYTMDDLQKKVLSGLCFVALSEDGQVLGITSVSLNADGSAYENISATSPLAKGLGIGTALANASTAALISKGAKYIISDTAVTAMSSVKWHLEKCECHKVGLESFPSTNYYSFVFRRDFVKQPFFVRNIKYPIKFAASFVKTRICKRADGRSTLLGCCLSKLKNVLRLN